MVTSEVIDIEELPDKTIAVWVCFKQDGKELPTYWNGQVLMRKEHKVWPLICQLSNFLSMSDAEKTTWVDKNIEHQFGNMIMTCAREAKNSVVISELKNLVIGRTAQRDTVDVAVGINGTGDRVVTLKDDGSCTVK